MGFPLFSDRKSQTSVFNSGNNTHTRDHLPHHQNVNLQPPIPIQRSRFPLRRQAGILSSCACLYFQAVEKTFTNPSVFEIVHDQPSQIVTSLTAQLTTHHGKSYPWAVGKGRQLPSGYIPPKKKNMNVDDNEVFSVYPGQTNNPGDLIKGRTFRKLNGTRKITIKDVPDLLKTTLNMQTFALGLRCIRQRRGSPMGSPLSPALCLVVVSISEQIWSINFRQTLANHHLFIRHIRYVDNRLIFGAIGDQRLRDLTPYEVLLDEGFYGKPIVLETEPDQEFLGFMLETQPLELVYGGPTNISQVLSPFSASPPKVLLSGFRSRCHIVIKGAFPTYRVQQGLDQLIDLYTLAGFSREELLHIATTLQDQAQPEKPLRLLPYTCLHTCSALVMLHFLPVVSVTLTCTCLYIRPGSNSLFPTLACNACDNMDPAHGQEIHYHLARALMHLNSIAGFLPFFDPAVDSDESEMYMYRRPPAAPPHFRRHLQTFVPIPAESSVPTLSSYGGMPTTWWSILNPIFDH